MTERYDIAIIGGGIMGCRTAIQLAKGGMRAVVVDKSDLGQGASGVNAGTLSLQIKRVKLMPYALKGYAEWESYGNAVGFSRTGGYTLAFTEEEAALLRERQKMKKDAGAPIDFLTMNTLRDREPEISSDVVAASYCPLDGYANASRTGQFFRNWLNELDIPFREHSQVTAITRLANGFELTTTNGTIYASRLLLAAGAYVKPLADMLGTNLPIHARVNTVSVTEAIPPLFSGVIGHATGLLTMKQKSNGTVLIGGGWQGTGTPETGRGHIDKTNLVSNFALAVHAVPGLATARILRSWTGFEAHVPDFYPLAGNLPGEPDIFIVGCVRGGYTIGPYIGQLMGDFILGRTPELPLFDPARNFDGE